MVGGIVVETLPCIIDGENRIWINCRENSRECAVFAEDTIVARSVSEGDIIWWQGRTIYWTPKTKDAGFEDYKIRRIGFSGVSRPDTEAITTTG